MEGRVHSPRGRGRGLRIAQEGARPVVQALCPERPRRLLLLGAVAIEREALVPPHAHLAVRLAHLRRVPARGEAHEGCVRGARPGQIGGAAAREVGRRALRRGHDGLALGVPEEDDLVAELEGEVLLVAQDLDRVEAVGLPAAARLARLARLAGR